MHFSDHYDQAPQRTMSEAYPASTKLDLKVKQKPIMIGIAGGSCSGKTRVAEEIVASLPAGDAVSIGLDSYYFDRPSQSAKEMNFDDPQALEKMLIVSHLRMLSSGEEIRKPVYDYVHHRRRMDTKLIRPMRFIIIEGLYALYWEEVRDLLTVKAFIELDHATCLERRLARDGKERGRTAESVVRQYRETVRPMYDQYVYPTRQFADLLLDGKDPVESLASSVLERLPR